MENRDDRDRKSGALEALSWMWASCERVAKSEAGSLDGPRPLWETWSVNAHQLYCPGCRRFRKQSRSLTRALRLLRSRGEGGEKLAAFSLPADIRHRLEVALKDADDSCHGPDASGPPATPPY
ncbi:hypothetical protein [Singulisphaera sp. PoT]|uniref:hypothetical protein n=1 Tax=Singulisphaera sp. PoT TaxID=3411797 RepID=UPI003BF49118